MALNEAQPVAVTYGRSPRVAPDALVRAHMALVRKIAWHVHARVASAIDVEDLIQIGMVALVECAKAFEDRGQPSPLMRRLRVRGARIDHLRRHATICRSAMARRRELADVRRRLENGLGRGAADVEMAAAMGLDAAAYRELIDESQAVQQDSIDDIYSDHSMWFADLEEQADEAIDRDRLKAAVAQAISGLPSARRWSSSSISSRR